MRMCRSLSSMHIVFAVISLPLILAQELAQEPKIMQDVTAFAETLYADSDPERVEAIDATSLKQRCCRGAYLASTPRYKGLNNQMNQFVWMTTFGALVNSTIIAPAIWSNYMPARGPWKHPRPCTVHGEPWLAASYAHDNGSCAALLDWELVYDINAMRAALWPLAFVLTQSELSSVCEVKAHVVETLPESKRVRGRCDLETAFFESAQARRRMHNFIAGRPHGILKICIDSDCRNTRGAPSCGSVFEGWARRRHDVSRAAWAWYRRVRYRVRISVSGR